MPPRQMPRRRSCSCVREGVAGYPTRRRQHCSAAFHEGCCATHADSVVACGDVSRRSGSTMRACAGAPITRPATHDPCRGGWRWDRDANDRAATRCAGDLQLPAELCCAAVHGTQAEALRACMGVSEAATVITDLDRDRIISRRDIDRRRGRVGALDRVGGRLSAPGGRAAPRCRARLTGALVAHAPRSRVPSRALTAQRAWRAPPTTPCRSARRGAARRWRREFRPALRVSAPRVTELLPHTPGAVHALRASARSAIRRSSVVANSDWEAESCRSRAMR
jgi:hypothetical protein